MLARRGFLGLRLRDDLVTAVWPGSAAARAGVQVGNRIVAIDGTPFTGEIPAVRAGESISITLDDRRTVAIPIDSWPLETTPHADTEYAHLDVAGARLRTITTIPHALSRAPATLLLPGLTLESLDPPPPAWAPIVHTLSTAGVTSMRVERRGIGDSEGGPASDVDFDTELAGYTAGARSLLDRADVDRLAIFGHSVGAMQAPLVAAAVPVTKIAVYGTHPHRWSDNMLPLARRQLALRNLADAALADALAREAAHAAAIRGSENASSIYGRSIAYHRQLDRAAIADAWSRYRGDVLVMHGEHDVVTDAHDHAAIGELLRVTALELPALGHSMLVVPDARAELEDPHAGEPTDRVGAALAAFLVGVGKLNT